MAKKQVKKLLVSKHAGHVWIDDFGDLWIFNGCTDQWDTYSLEYEPTSGAFGFYKYLPDNYIDPSTGEDAGPFRRVRLRKPKL